MRSPLALFRLSSHHARILPLSFVVTQMMMGGNKKRQLRPNEHIMAAITLYTDILNLFLHILSAMARAERD